MPGFSDIDTLTTPAGTISFNDDTGDTLFVDPKRSSGMGMPLVRAPIDNKGQTDGYIVHPFFLEGRHLVLAGMLLIRSAATEAGYRTARDALSSGTEAKLRSILQADGTLTIGAATLTVRCDLGVDFPAIEGMDKGFVFGLVSASSAAIVA